MKNSIGKADQIKSIMTSHMKTYAIYDANGRTTHFYEAPTFTNHDDPCLLTQFSYIGTNPSVEKSHESEATWDSSWNL